MINKLSDRVFNGVATIGTTAIKIREALQQGERSVLVITNASTGGQTIYLYIGQQPTSAAGGIPLNPNGSWQEANDAGFKCYNGEVWAIASAAAGSIAIHERCVN